MKMLLQKRQELKHMQNKTDNHIGKQLVAPVWVRSVYRIALQIIAAWSVSEYSEQEAPLTVGQYRFVAKIKKNMRQHEYRIGKYEKNGNSYFIKSWVGSTHTLSYRLLQKEFATAGVLYQKLTRSRLNLRVPKPIEWIEKDGMASAVYEYIDGTVLFKATAAECISCYLSILTDLKKVSRTLTPEEQAVVGRQNQLFYMVSIVFFGVVRAVLSPRNINHIVKLVIGSVKHLIVMDKHAVTLAHRDLSRDNIMRKGDKNYLIDTGLMTVTYEGFDHVDAGLKANDTRLPRILQSTIAPENYAFYVQYIDLHRDLTRYANQRI